jgi:drug/metabolite transporter (DMT)-like permease
MRSTWVLYGRMYLTLTTRPFCSLFSRARHQTQGTSWFLIFAGAILGITAALLWSAQGCIMMSYPLEKDKGKAFGVFWAIFQFGSFIGAIIALAINLRQGHLDAVATSTYIVSSLFSGIMRTSSLTPTGFLLHYRPS